MIEFKYDIDIKIANPNNILDARQLFLRAQFHHRQDDYGNGYYLSIKGRQGTDFERLFDIRYDNFNIDNPELFILNWIYNNWSGRNGSHDVISLKISNVDAMKQVRSNSHKSLTSNVIY